MKKSPRLIVHFGGIILFTIWSSQAICHAQTGKRGTVAPETVDIPSVSVVDPAEEALKIRRLVKLALNANATDTIRKSLSEEIAYVEKKRKLKEEVTKHLLQDDDSDMDPTLPKVKMATYKDGTVRGLVFIQTDAAPSRKPATIAWAFDSKREKGATEAH